GGNLIFLTDDKTYTFTEPVTEFFVRKGSDVVSFKKGGLISKGLPEGYYTTVSNQPHILKASTVNLVEVPVYGASTKQFRFVQGKAIYAVKDGVVSKINLTKSDAEKVFEKHWSAVNEFASKNKISFKTEEGWISLAKQYQSLEQVR
ncbi:MAG TPA: hypothetical protein VGB56_09370, partial [Flavisolibacter sp.]